MHIFASGNHEVILKNSHREAIASLAKRMLAEVHGLDEDYLDLLQLASFQLPDDLKRALIRFRRRPNGHGFLLIRNLPIEQDLPPTPIGEADEERQDLTLSDLVLITVSLLIGEPIAYDDEKSGRLVHDIFPIKGYENNIEGRGSRAKFTHHTEDAIHPNRPDYLSLLCVRSDHNKHAINETSSVVDALPLLPASAISILRAPLFEVSPPLSFDSGNIKATIPVLSGSLFMPEMRFHGHFMRGLTHEAEWALARLRSALEAVRVKSRLEPGDCLIVNNRTTTHARSGFRPRYDGGDRWLKRVYGVVDLFRSIQSRGWASRSCAPLSVELKGVSNRFAGI